MLQGKIIVDAAIIHDISFHHDGAEVKRNSHGGPDRLRQVSLSEYNFPAIANIYGIA